MEQTLDAIKNLPPNWWRTEAACETLAKLFNEHMLVLLISLKTKSESIQKHFSGFLLDFGNQLYWITAAHVINAIQGILSSNDFKIERVFWLDVHENPQAGATIVSNKVLDSFASKEVDFGMVRIKGLEKESVLANPNVRVFTPLAWKGLPNANPEGYYLVGFPDEWSTSQELEGVGSQIKRVYKADIACLPIEKLEFDLLSNEAQELWSDTEAFYGKILGIENSQIKPPDNIVGMSGGPVISIERRKDGHLIYRLVGIQSRWLPESKIIKAESINKLAELYLSDSFVDGSLDS